jgi:hypothetical protein
LLPQASPSELKIVGGPAGTIKLPFKKLNTILCQQLGVNVADPHRVQSMTALLLAAVG